MERREKLKAYMKNMVIFEVNKETTRNQEIGQQQDKIEAIDGSVINICEEYTVPFEIYKKS